MVYMDHLIRATFGGICFLIKYLVPPLYFVGKIRGQFEKYDKCIMHLSLNSAEFYFII